MICPKQTNDVKYWQIKTNTLAGLDRKCQIKMNNYSVMLLMSSTDGVM